jgi:hypothetical protein
VEFGETLTAFLDENNTITVFQNFEQRTGDDFKDIGGTTLQMNVNVKQIKFTKERLWYFFKI